MRAAVVSRTLADGRGMLLWLCFGLALFAALTISFFPTFKDQGEVMMKVMPSFLRKMMGARAPWNTVEGFAHWELTHPLFIALSLTWGVAFASRAIAGAIERGTLGLVLANPISRTRYYMECVAAMLIGEAIAIGVGVLAFSIGFYALGLPPRGGLPGIGLTFLQGVLVYGAFGALVLLVSSIASEGSKAVAFGISIIALSAFLTLFAPVVEPLKHVEWLSLFYFYHPYEALRGLASPIEHYLIPLGVASGALAIGWRAFLRRDLSI
ncbi:MAG: ABC transporter permease subunit [Candidatus Sericytochromatia bacterium]|nr:ABC transporter permease subunit [Candidatus Tanganyikabacteria bacterium]